MEQRLFAAVAQLQPLAPWLLLHTLAAELDLQQCMVLRMYLTSAKGVVEQRALAILQECLSCGTRASNCWLKCPGRRQLLAPLQCSLVVRVGS